MLVVTFDSVSRKFIKVNRNELWHPVHSCWARSICSELQLILPPDCKSFSIWIFYRFISVYQTNIHGSLSFSLNTNHFFPSMYTFSYRVNIDYLGSQIILQEVITCLFFNTVLLPVWHAQRLAWVSHAQRSELCTQHFTHTRVFSPINVSQKKCNLEVRIRQYQPLTGLTILLLMPPVHVYWLLQ